MDRCGASLRRSLVGNSGGTRSGGSLARRAATFRPHACLGRKIFDNYSDYLGHQFAKERCLERGITNRPTSGSDKSYARAIAACGYHDEIRCDEREELLP